MALRPPPARRFAAEEVVGIQDTDNHVGIGHRRVFRTPPERGTVRIGAAQAVAQQAEVDAGGAAAGDFDHVDGEDHDRHAAAVEQAVRSTSTGR